MIRWFRKSNRPLRDLTQSNAERLREVLGQSLEAASVLDGSDGLDGMATEAIPPMQSETVGGQASIPGHDIAGLANEMAATFLGFGDWKAPYWFIGLEPGKAPGEDAGNSHIVRAWGNGLKKSELVDCLEYHRAIGVDTWHKERARLQPTWRPLMLLLMVGLGRDSDKEALRAYQRTRWGRIENAETCVMDLSGIPAKDIGVDTDREKYLKQRIWILRRKIMLSDHPPRLVVMHGLAARSHWEEIAGVALEPDRVVKVGSTVFVMTASSTVPGRKNADWERLGLEVRRHLHA